MDLEQTIIAIIRGELGKLPKQASPEQWELLLRRADQERVTALLHHWVFHHDATRLIPQSVVDALKHRARSEAKLDITRHRELCEVLDLLERGRVRPLLMKGVPLAYTLYPDPSLRPRTDTDLLVTQEEARVVRDGLEERGYQACLGISGAYVSYQQTFHRVDAIGVRHTIDVHWRLNNNPCLAQALDFAQLSARAVPVPRISKAARGLCGVDALVLACLHRAGHSAHDNPNTLIWLYDIHLLCESLGDHELSEFTDLVRDRKVATICLDGIEQARSRFHTGVSGGALAALRAGARQREPSAVLLKASPLGHMWANLWARPSTTSRLGLLREVFFPPGDYLLTKYETDDRRALPWLYARRIGEGLAKLVRRRGR